MTTATRSVPVIDFDHHSEQFARDLEGRARNLLAHPIAYTESNGGHYVVSSHELVREVLLDTDTYSSARTTDGAGGLFIPSFPIPLPGGALLPAESDPPRHTDLRKVLNPFFTRSACEAMRTSIEAIVAGAIDEIVNKGEFDVVYDLGHVVGPTTMMSYLGFPLELRDRFIDAIRTGYMRKPGDDDVSDLLELAGMVYGVINDKRENPTDDVASKLIHDKDAGFSDVELVSLLVTLLFGGFETTESLIANTLIHLDTDRALRQRLIDDPSLIPGAVDEFLRVITPETTTARRVTRDVELGGVALKEGEFILLVLTAANHDDTVFDEPVSIDPARKLSQSMAFGFGVHRCIGAIITRIESIAILEQLLARIPDYSLHMDQAERFPDLSAANGWLNIPASTNLG
jgi:cytochrome P450